MSGNIDIGGNLVQNANYYSLVNNHGRFAWDSSTNHTWLQGSSSGYMTISGLNSSTLRELRLYASNITTSGTLTLSHSSFGQGLIIKRSDSNNTPAITYSNNSATFGRIGVGSSQSPYPNEPLFYPGTSTTPEKIWTSGNDGSSSGLDADLLDGTHKSGLFTNMSYSSNTLSVTVGGTTKTVTINAGITITPTNFFRATGENVTSNWNNYTTIGAYSAYPEAGSFSQSNAPAATSGKYGTLLVFDAGYPSLVQMFVAQYAEKDVYIRMRWDNNRWSAWQKIGG